MQLNGDSVTNELDLGGALLGFKASNIRRTRTGVHARIEIRSGPHLLGYDTFNLERHADRVRLSNACATKSLTKAVIRVHLDDFCAGVWRAWIAQYAPEEIAPNLDDVQETKFLLNPYLAQGSGTILFAPPGVGKSYLALLMAQSINQGCSAIWRSEKKRVLYLNLERSRESLSKRLALVNMALDLPADTPLWMSNARGKTLQHVSEALPASGYDVIFLDSLSRSGAGSMVDDEMANAVMDAINAMSASWLVIAHTPKADHSTIFGSQMFGAAADLTIGVKSARNAAGDLGLLVRGDKANDIPLPKDACYKMRFDEYGLCEFGTALVSEFPKLTDESEDRLESIREYLMAVGEASMSDIVDAVGSSRSSVQRALEDGQDVGRRKDGKRILYSIRSDRSAHQ